uniref:Ubiquinol-cytochrome-c reductase complex assembly factor 3 n=1 Tax=Oncorhynchus kisutch TaxID=8019 RepID=A0A8C7LJ13_ONCKI
AKSLILASKALVGALGVGYTMFSVISPGEERKKELIQNFPEANPVRMEDTRRRNALVMLLRTFAKSNPNKTCIIRILLLGD